MPIQSALDIGGNHFNKDGRDGPIPSQYKNIAVVALGEFCGTFMFLLLSFIGTQVAIDNNSPGSPDARLAPFSLLYIAASFGTALAVNVWIFYRVTGGMFNPAVTLGLVLVGAVAPLRGLIVIPTQFVAGIAAAAVTDGLLPGSLGVANTLGDGTSVVRGLFIEMFLTAQLVLTVYFLAVEKHRATFLAPIGIGMAVFIAHICGTNFTGTGINPARSFGPAVVTSFPGYHWIYWLGPVMGSLLAFALYSLLKWVDYATANPGQDSDDLEKAHSCNSQNHSCHHNRNTSHGSSTVHGSIGDAHMGYKPTSPVSPDAPTAANLSSDAARQLP